MAQELFKLGHAKIEHVEAARILSVVSAVKGVVDLLKGNDKFDLDMDYIRRTYVECEEKNERFWSNYRIYVNDLNEDANNAPRWAQILFAERYRIDINQPNTLIK